MYVQNFEESFWANVNAIYLNLWKHLLTKLEYLSLTSDNTDIAFGGSFPHVIQKQIDLQKLQSFKRQVACCWKIHLNLGIFLILAVPCQITVLEKKKSDLQWTD